MPELDFEPGQQGHFLTPLMQAGLDCKAFSLIEDMCAVPDGHMVMTGGASYDIGGYRSKEHSFRRLEGRRRYAMR